MLQEQIVECVPSNFTKTAKEVPADVSPVAANIHVINLIVKKARVDLNLVKAYSIIQNYEALVQSRVKDVQRNPTTSTVTTTNEIQD